ncbi:MAG: tetratricopeptide repeat protein [Planctomycetes bacterium]|nr:tetratricopeptide repeat protein [Planctomycetota bacterium]
MQAVLPHLKGCNAGALAEAVTSRWPVTDVCGLLGHSEIDVRRVAAVTIGLIGDKHSIPPLVRSLRDADEQVNQMAEYALWSIWFRGGNAKAARPFREGVSMLAAEKYDSAAACFEESTRIDHDFAEAYNQGAIAQFFLGQWQRSINSCKRAIERVPQHFGAISGMGHCYTQMGQLDQALLCYRQALKINPRMPAITRACHRIEARIHDLSDSSGMFLAGAASE